MIWKREREAVGPPAFHRLGIRVEGMDGNLNPAGHATRAQIATILLRFCEGVAK